jgi:hypothetical protein
MVKIENIRFKGPDQYGNLNFICNSKYEADAFKQLQELSEKLQRVFPNSYNPVYYNSGFEYCIVQARKDLKYKLHEDTVYDIEFDVVTYKRNDDSVGLRCVLKSCKFVKRVEREDEIVDVEKL